MTDSVPAQPQVMTLDALEKLDNQGVTIHWAIQYGEPPPISSHASPHSFVCRNGKVYWVKATAQNGLAAELIAGRLAKLAGAGPDAQVIYVSIGIVPQAAQHLVGIVVGIEEQRGTINARQLQQLVTQGLGAGLADASSRARVVCFQSWIGVSDSQVLVNPTHGLVYSIDHGAAFGNLDPQEPVVVVTQIPGISDDLGRSRADVDSALKTIERISDADILGVVSCIPEEVAWNADRGRRLQIANWLASRRGQLRKVMSTWAQ